MSLIVFTTSSIGEVRLQIAWGILVSLNKKQSLMLSPASLVPVFSQYLLSVVRFCAHAILEKHN